MSDIDIPPTIPPVESARPAMSVHQSPAFAERSVSPMSRAINGSIPRPPVLIDFHHGLGNAVQLTIALKHLQHYYPNWDVDVAALPGKHTGCKGLCKQVLASEAKGKNQAQYLLIHHLEWHECRTAESAAPSSKPVRCLREVFGLTPLSELCRYSIKVSAEVREQARRYLAEICPQGPKPDDRFPVVLIHDEGNTSRDKKDLPHDVIRDIGEVILQQQHVPVILDWDRRSPLPDSVRIHCPEADHPLWNGLGTGDTEMLAALIEASSLVIGVDSGPLHVAGATSTPTLAAWTHHHSVHSFDLAENVFHFVPGDYTTRAAGAAICFCESTYRFSTYKKLSIDLPAQIEACLTGVDFDNEELFARQGRTLEHEDPTHVCIQQMSWRHEQLAAHGWEICVEEICRPLINHPAKSPSAIVGRRGQFLSLEK